MSKAHKEAMKILEKHESLDFVGLAWEIAKEAPATFCKAAYKFGATQDPKIKAELECMDLMRQGKKINAIKCWRNATGTGLKESKEFVESL